VFRSWDTRGQAVVVIGSSAPAAIKTASHVLIPMVPTPPEHERLSATRDLSKDAG
jgi:hypothetical protein